MPTQKKKFLNERQKKKKIVVTLILAVKFLNQKIIKKCVKSQLTKIN